MQKATDLRRNVVDFSSYRRDAQYPAMMAPPRRCRHCGAWLADDESEDDCSSVFRAYETFGARS